MGSVSAMVNRKVAFGGQGFRLTSGGWMFGALGLWGSAPAADPMRREPWGIRAHL